MRPWCVLAFCACGLYAAGCREPEDIVSAAPPGVVADRAPKEADDKGPQALGEQNRGTVDESSSKPAPKEVTPAPPTAKGEVKTTPSGLKYETLKPGDGPEVKAGQTVTVKYRGTLQDGTQFDANDKADFAIASTGPVGVIAGWDQGVVGMKVGEKRKLIVPPALGYGETGAGKIPPNATLTFEIEVLGAK